MKSRVRTRRSRVPVAFGDLYCLRSRWASCSPLPSSPGLSPRQTRRGSVQTAATLHAECPCSTRQGMVSTSRRKACWTRERMPTRWTARSGFHGTQRPGTAMWTSHDHHCGQWSTVESKGQLYKVELWHYGRVRRPVCRPGSTQRADAMQRLCPFLFVFLTVSCFPGTSVAVRNS